MTDVGRTPPGQTLTEKFPVLHVGEIPQFNEREWTLEIGGLVKSPIIWTWKEFLALAQSDSQSDFHCVTHWSRLDNLWSGVSFKQISKIVQPEPEAAFVVFGDIGMYTTNLPIEACLEDDVIFAHSHDGIPLTPEHGAPLRVVVPKRYGWKSCKWVRSVEFVSKDVLGFWETRGYSNTALPFEDDRFAR